MAVLTPGFRRTKSDSAFYIESDLRCYPTGSLNLGFRIVYRVIVRYPRGASTNSAELAKQVREAFMSIFGLDEKHVNVNIEEPVVNYDSATLWEVYWDKSGDLDLRKINKCDAVLNSIAKRSQVVIEHIGTTIMARELSYLRNFDMH